ncbi:hypothetical protein D9756_003620 [Leucocoprinus leucothites]|uniref:Cytochrome P450 n=1 Tax=Leucocoprinus leucothites TaxID=201217 RepID=A0A8H5G6X9_9AGAR|nr:hypothetical protein D9756_003620 [Leucoagaricus leucothites]
MIENLSDRVSPEREAAEEASRSACAAGFAGGSDTTVSTVHSFFLAMCLYPEVQKKAQTELDMVLGGRLPEFNDKESLPYITAMVKESLRWQQVAPLGVPHMATEADEYNGYYIPKGTIVIGNAWTILHDPEVYSHPFEYKPDRFLTKEGKLNTRVPDPGSLAAFGFGRRVCLGRFLTENSMFILFAHILAVYDIRPGLSRNGREVIIKPEMTSGMLSYPEPFKCRITPRSKQAEYLVQNSTLLLMD